MKSTSVTTKLLLDGGNVYFGRLPVKEVRERDPKHDGSNFGVVWVNDIGREAITAEKPAKFPVGSVIVREKFIEKDDPQPQLLAVMIKRTTGFSRKSGDWEYFIVDGGLKKIRERQKKGSCSGCHSSQKERDFVFPVTITK